MSITAGKYIYMGSKLFDSIHGFPISQNETVERILQINICLTTRTDHEA